MDTGLRCAALGLALAAAMAADLAAAGGPGDRAAAIVASTAAALHKTVIGREIAFRALENAAAAYDDARQTMGVALQGGRERAIGTARKSLKAASEDYERALTAVEEVVTLARAIETAAADAGAAAAEAGTNATARAAERAVDRAVKIARDSGRSLARFDSVVDALTEKWLIPLASTTITVSSPTTTTTGQPSVLTPLNPLPQP